MVLARVQRLAEGLRAVTRRPGVRKALWVAAAVVFALLSIFAFVALPEGLSVRPMGIVLAVVTVPFVVGLNSAEFLLLGRMNSTEFGFSSSMRITLAGTLANLAPVPGALTIRVSAIVARGGRISRALTSSLAAGLMWLGMSLIFGSMAVGFRSDPVWAMLFAAGGIAATAVGFVVAVRIAGRMTVALQLLLIEISITLVTALRVLIIFFALGLTGNYAQSIVITMSSVLATVTGFFPAGLGLSELLAGVTAPLTGLTASVAVVVAVFDRLVRFASLAGLSLIARPWRSANGIEES